MKGFKKVAEGISISEMVAALYHNHEAWEQIKARQETPGSAHSETKTIFLRWAPEFTIDAVFNQIEAIDCPMLKVFPEATDLVNAFCKILNPTQLGRVIITSLRAHGKIDPHVDEGAYADHYQRFHIPISCGEGSKFCVSYNDGEGPTQETVHMKPGELWWFDNKKTHWVENPCDTARVHVIFDAVVPGWEREYDRANRRSDINNIVGGGS